MNRRVRLTVLGRVQGVGFRYFVRKRALELGLEGEVRNLPDGTVEVIATGTNGSLEALIGLVNLGPRGAVVSDVRIEWDAPVQQMPGFRIRD